MKKHIIILIIGLLAVGFLHAQIAPVHFVPAWHGQAPYLGMNIYVRCSYVNGSPLVPGDEIAVFDGDLLVGATQMNKIATLENGLTEIRVSSEGGGVPGSATTGHFIKFKVWKQSTNTEYSYPEMSVWFDTPIVTTFSPQASSFIERLQYDTPSSDTSESVPALTPGVVPINYPEAHLSITALGAYYVGFPAPTYYPSIVTTAGDIRVIYIEEPPIGVGFTGTAPDVYSQFHWYIDPGTTGITTYPGYPITIRIDTTNLPGFIDCSELKVYKRTIHGTPFFEECTTTWTDPYLDVSITSFSEFILAGPSSSTLPVELSSFTATLTVNNYVSLNWITQSETGVVGFKVYRSVEQDLSGAEVISPLIEATNTSTAQSYVYVDTELNQDGTYYYWLENTDLDGSNDFYGPITVYFTITNGNQNPPAILFDGIDSIYPNPFNPTTNISFGLKSQADVDISIYNLRGQLVKRLLSGNREAGVHRAIWDGTMDSGSICGSGIYLVKMSLGNRSFTQRVMLMK